MKTEERARVLVLLANAHVRRAVCDGLRAAGYIAFAGEADGDLEAGIEAFGPDAVIARLDSHGRRELFAVLRSAQQVPVIATAAVDVPSWRRVEAIRSGVEGIYDEPPPIDELVARLDTLLATRRRRRILTVHDLTIDLDGHIIRRSGSEIRLTATEYRLLIDFVENVGVVVSKRRLLERIWEFGDFDVNVVEVHVSALRRKLEAHGARLIHTVRGIGYVMRDPEPVSRTPPQVDDRPAPLDVYVPVSA